MCDVSRSLTFSDFVVKNKLVTHVPAGALQQAMCLAFHTNSGPFLLVAYMDTFLPHVISKRSILSLRYHLTVCNEPLGVCSEQPRVLLHAYCVLK